jgi:hypothetical protein
VEVAVRKIEIILGVIAIFVLSYAACIGIIAGVDALTDGGDERPVIQGNVVCIEYVDPWGNVERTECPSPVAPSPESGAKPGSSQP